jgi:hypothetical protein
MTGSGTLVSRAKEKGQPACGCPFINFNENYLVGDKLPLDYSDLPH